MIIQKQEINNIRKYLWYTSPKLIYIWFKKKKKKWCVLNFCYLIVFLLREVSFFVGHLFIYMDVLIFHMNTVVYFPIFLWRFSAYMQLAVEKL